MSNAASMFHSDADSYAQDRIDDAFRGRILAALRDVRARERRASSPGLRLGDAANDDAQPLSA